jgi:hypothetical protein
VNAAERDIWTHLEAVHAGDLALAAFEQWLYATPGVETALGADAWLALVSLDYDGRFAAHEVRTLVERLYAQRRPGALPADQARRVAREFLADDRDLWSTCATLARLWSQGGEDWVPIDFVGLDSELDAIPAPGIRTRWEPAALQARLSSHASWLEGAHEAAREAARRMLEQLDAREPAV